MVLKKKSCPICDKAITHDEVMNFKVVFVEDEVYHKSCIKEKKDGKKDPSLL